MDAYKKAGVDIEAGHKFIKEIKRDSHNKQLGSFAGTFPLNFSKYKNPILVSSTDGVGTKLLIANRANIHETIGIDLVAMCINDILAQGAKPLFFLDYLGIGHLNNKKGRKILSGILKGVSQAKSKLIGGETAEMPSMYPDGHYDLAGFAVGIANKKQLLKTNNLKTGDILIGLPSNGLHSNGFSLVRDILFKENNYKLNDKLPHSKISLAQELLKPTAIYFKTVYPLIKQGLITAIAHITGGGLIENMSRILPKNLSAIFNIQKWKVPNIMKDLQVLGQLSFKDMENTFNLGLGMVLVVHKNKLKKAIKIFKKNNKKFFIVGKIIKGKQKVIIRGN